MLTSYFVKCPHLGCDWLGSRLPRQDRNALGAMPQSNATVTFQCPSCHGEWNCRVVGDDVVPISVESGAAMAAV